MKRIALILALAVSSGCALNAEIRYPWDKQKDKQEVVSPKQSKLQTVPVEGEFFDPTPSLGQIAMAKK